MTLNELYDLLESTSYYSAGTNLKRGYSKAYPAEAAAVEAYWRQGGPRPIVATRFGRFLLDTVDMLRPVTPPPEPPPSSDWDRFLTYYKTRPDPFVPDITLTNETEARAALAAVKTGQKIRVLGVNFTTARDEPVLRLYDLPACTIDFVGSIAHHTGRTNWPVIDTWRWHADTKVYGLDITGPQANNGIRTEDSRGTWWGFKIHDCGGTGLMTVTKEANDGPYDYRGEITNCALRLDLDPHTEPGTGGHAAYIGGSNQNLTGNSGTFVLYIHDQPYGAGIQLGSYVYDSTVVAWAERLTFNAQSQVAGNVLQWWGGNLRNIQVPFVYGKDLAGRVSETDGVYGSGAQNVVVEYGRGHRVCQNPRLTNVAFTPEPGFTYRDCQATF